MSDELTAVQQEILEVAESNPELSNGEIAEQVGARIPNVRDVRSAHDLEQPAEASGASDDDDSVLDELNEVQEAILEAAAADPELTNAEIADQVGARITNVRDTRAAYADEVDVEPATGGDAGGEPSAGGTQTRDLAILVGVVVLLLVLGLALGGL